VSGDTAARAVLVFCAIPACSDVKLVNDGDSVEFLDENAGGDNIYWDYRDRGEGPSGVDLREKVLFHPDTVRNLVGLLRVAQARLQAAGDPDHVLDRYQDDTATVREILTAVLRGQLIGSLFPVEGNMVEEARNAGLKMAAFRKDQFSDPEQARNDLARFGQKLSEDFNSNLKTFAVGNGLLPLGTAVYIAAATSLGATAPAVAAMFTLRMIKDGAAFPPPGLEPANEADVLRTERVVHA